MCRPSGRGTTSRTGIASALVVDGRVYVVDCGRSAVTQYGLAGLKYGDLESIFITHLHADHTADFHNFPLLAGNGGADPITTTVDAYGPGRRAPSGADPLGDTAPDMAPFPVADDGTVRVSAVLVPHGPVFPSFAYRFDTPSGSVVFSGDCSLNGNLERLGRGTDVLVHEVIDADFYRSEDYPPATLDHLLQSHTDVADLGPLAERCGVSTLVLSHYGPANTAQVPTESFRRRAQRGFSGRVIGGEELDVVPLGEGA